MTNYKWVAFVFDDGDGPSFYQSNPCFHKCSNIDSCNVEIGDWFEFSDNKNAPVFRLLKCDKGIKNDLFIKLHANKATIKDVKNAFKRLIAWAGEWLDQEGLVFLHWHQSLEESIKKTEALEELLKADCPNLTFRCVSSKLPSLNQVPLFDIGNPIIPVKDFYLWFNMFESYWRNKNIDDVYRQYQKPFPDHRTLGGNVSNNNDANNADTKNATVTPQELNTVNAKNDTNMLIGSTGLGGNLNSTNDENTASSETPNNPKSEVIENEGSSQPTGIKGFFMRIPRFFSGVLRKNSTKDENTASSKTPSNPKSEVIENEGRSQPSGTEGAFSRRLLGFLRWSTHVLTGFIAGIISLLPLAALVYFMPREEFRRLHDWTVVEVLVLFFLFAVFATCVWGGLFWASSKHDENERD